MFQLIGVVSALTPEGCIKENKELRKFTEFRERKKKIQQAWQMLFQAEVVSGVWGKMTTDLAEHQGSVQS